MGDMIGHPARVTGGELANQEASLWAVLSCILLTYSDCLFELFMVRERERDLLLFGSLHYTFQQPQLTLGMLKIIQVLLNFSCSGFYPSINFQECLSSKPHLDKRIPSLANRTGSGGGLDQQLRPVYLYISLA